MRASSCAAVVLVLGVLVGAASAQDNPRERAARPPGVGTAQQQVGKALDRYDDAAKKASHVYYVAVVAADKQLVSDLTTARKAADTSTVDDVRAKLDAARAKLDHDLNALKTDAEVVDGQTPDPADAKAKQRSGFTNSVGIKLGMSEADCDAAENDHHWKKVVIEIGADGKQVEYQSGFFYVKGFQEKDICWFVDGKLAKYRPVRVDNLGSNLPPSK